ncbi:MAG: hypothetical protein V4578_26715 [Pseudomonadota bacterium]
MSNEPKVVPEPKKDDAIEEFLGVRVLTPLEEEKMTGGVGVDHDHDCVDKFA